MIKNETLKIIAAGDACFYDRENIIDREYAEGVLAEIKPYLENADLRIINLENPLAPAGTGAPIFKGGGPNLMGEPKNIGFLEAGGFDCAILANNHTGDYGGVPLCSTIRLLNDHNIAYAGAGINLDDAYRACRLEKKGIKVSIIASAENEYGGATTTDPGSAMFIQGRLAGRIREEKKASDFVIVYFHGGSEYNPFPSPRVIDRYRSFCDCGADAVIATHTHCPQGYEIYNGKPVIYSMGNLYFPSIGQKEACSSWYYGYMTALTLAKGKDLSFSVIPYRFVVEATRISPFGGNELVKFMEYLDEISEAIKDPEAIEKYHTGWCALKGPSMAKRLCIKPEYLETLSKGDADARKTLFYFRSLFNCEAHCELMAKYFRIVCENRFEEACRYAEELKKYFIMPV